MAKAGKNLRFLRTGLTVLSHVAVAGEVFPLPPAESGWKPKTPEEQKDYYGMVHYITTNDPVNVGPTATVPFVRMPEPLDDNDFGRPLPQAVNVPKKSETERGGGGGQVNLPPNARTAPDELSVPGHEDKAVLKAIEEDRKRDEESEDDEDKPRKKKKKGRVIVLTRPKTKKKLVAAKPTRMGRSKQ